MLVERLDAVRNRLLDDPPPIDILAIGVWEQFRIDIDRELRAIQLQLASLCPPT